MTVHFTAPTGLSPRETLCLPNGHRGWRFWVTDATKDVDCKRCLRELTKAPV